MRLKKKMLCYVLVFDQVEIIRKSLEFLSTNSSLLDLVIIENPSPNTPKIQKIVNKLGNEGLVKRYYLFEDNVTGNAYDLIINHELAKVEKSQFVIVTDGDLISKNNEWLNEERRILKKHKDVFACGVSLDMSNLPIKAFPEARGWIPSDMSQNPDFYEAFTGGHLLMFRGKEFATFMRWKNDEKLNFVDGIMHKYCYEEVGKKWARTRNTLAYHLTWDLYQDRAHPYTQFKLEKNFQDTWYHKRQATFTLTEY